MAKCSTGHFSRSDRGPPMNPKLRLTPLDLLGAAAVLGAPTCTVDDPSVNAYLLVAVAARQPQSATLGTVVVLQQRGGASVRITVSAGTFLLPGDAPDAGG